MKRHLLKANGGMTLAELMMSIGCGSLILGAVLTSSVALQRSYFAVEAYSTAAGDQLRVLDYIAMDSRRAVGAVVAGNTVTLTVPNYYDGAGAPRFPTFTAGGAIQYGGGTTPISYYQSGSKFMRQVNGVEKAIATDVATFTVTPIDLTSSLSCSITFSPRFTTLAGAGVAGTTVYINTFLRNASARQ